MEKALEMGKVSAIGSFQLFIGKSTSSIILAIGSIILARLMLPAEYGLYTIALVPSLTIILFHDWGISVAMVKYVAQYKAMNKEEEIRDIIAVGLIFKFATGLVLSILSLFLATFIAISIFNRPEIAPLISLASITILSESLLTASQSNFTGFERMKLKSLTLICHSILKSIISPLLLLLGYGALGAVLGYTFSLLVAALLGLTLLYFRLFKNLKKSWSRRTDKIKTLKMLLHYGLPISLSTILGGFLAQFYFFLMAFYCSNVMIGNYQIALNFALLLSFVTFPISTVLFPAFSKLDPKNEPQLLKKVFKSSVKYTALFLVPATAIVMIMSKPMIITLFGEQYVYAPFFLTIYVINNLFYALGRISLSSFLAGLGETKTLMKLSLLTLLFGLPLALLLIPSLGIIGVILVTLFADVPSIFLGLYWIRKHYDVTVDWGSSAKIFIASAIAAAATYLSITFLGAAEWLTLIIGVIVFLTTYLIVAPSIGAIIQDDIANLRSMLSGLGFISTIVNLPLGVVEKIVAISSGRKKVKAQKD